MTDSQDRRHRVPDVGGGDGATLFLKSALVLSWAAVTAVVLALAVAGDLYITHYEKGTSKGKPVDLHMWAWTLWAVTRVAVGVSASAFVVLVGWYLAQVVLRKHKITPMDELARVVRDEFDQMREGGLLGDASGAVEVRGTIWNDVDWEASLANSKVINLTCRYFNNLFVHKRESVLNFVTSGGRLLVLLPDTDDDELCKIYDRCGPTDWRARLDATIEAIVDIDPSAMDGDNLSGAGGGISVRRTTKPIPYFSWVSPRHSSVVAFYNIVFEKNHHCFPWLEIDQEIGADLIDRLSRDFDNEFNPQGKTLPGNSQW